jgi:hypothetical protein
MTSWPGRFIQPDDRRHAAPGHVAGFLHELAALAHHPQAILETHRARRRQRREFTERQAGGGVKFERRRLFLEQLEGNPAHEKNSRLGIFSPGQFRLRAVETNGGQVVAQRGVGAVKPGFGRGIFFGQVLAHADGLGALAGE